MRSDAVAPELEVEPLATLSYALIVPRSILPDKSATGIDRVKELPYVQLDSDGDFTRRMDQLFAEHRLPAREVGRVESYSLAIEMAKVMEAATIVPKQAIKEFAADRFAAVELEGIARLDRELVVVSNKRTAQLNTRAKRAAIRLSRLFSRPF